MTLDVTCGKVVITNNQKYIRGKGIMNYFPTSGLGLRPARVSSNSAISDEAEREKLILTSSDQENLNEPKKFQGRPWKAKREDYDYNDHVFGIGTNERVGAIVLQRTRALNQPSGNLSLGCWWLAYLC